MVQQNSWAKKQRATILGFKSRASILRVSHAWRTLVIYFPREKTSTSHLKWRAGSVTFCWTNDKAVAFFLSWKIALFHFYSI